MVAFIIVRHVPVNCLRSLSPILRPLSTLGGQLDVDAHATDRAADWVVSA
jgi:hypothetical protein